MKRVGTKMGQFSLLEMQLIKNIFFNYILNIKILYSHDYIPKNIK